MVSRCARTNAGSPVLDAEWPFGKRSAVAIHHSSSVDLAWGRPTTVRQNMHYRRGGGAKTIPSCSSGAWVKPEVCDDLGMPAGQLHCPPPLQTKGGLKERAQVRKAGRAKLGRNRPHLKRLGFGRNLVLGAPLASMGLSLIRGPNFLILDFSGIPPLMRTHVTFHPS